MRLAELSVVVLVAVVALLDQAGLISLGTELAYGEQYTRVAGLMDDPNYFSFQLLIALAFAVHVAMAAKSAGVSTTHKRAASRPASLQMGHMVWCEKVWQRWQCTTESSVCTSAWASARAPSWSRCIR